ncbi:MAG: hypothetical protein P8099_21355 [Gemmatimonadota bacterium]
MTNHKPFLRLAAALFLAGTLAACVDSVDGVNALGSVRVYGLALRGPTQPVCTVNDPCTQPFAAGFTVYQGSREVRRFWSDINGRFAVRLDPGNYTVVPDSTAPVLAQSQDMTVPAADSTFVTLTFDTGIR